MGGARKNMGGGRQLPKIKRGKCDRGGVHLLLLWARLRQPPGAGDFVGEDKEGAKQQGMGDAIYAWKLAAGRTYLVNGRKNEDPEWRGGALVMGGLTGGLAGRGK